MTGIRVGHRAALTSARDPHKGLIPPVSTSSLGFPSQAAVGAGCWLMCHSRLRQELSEIQKNFTLGYKDLVGTEPCKARATPGADP